MLKKLVENMIKSMVEKPEHVVVEYNVVDGKNVLSIEVDPLDRGKVIGKKGGTIKALRTFVSIVAADNKQIEITLVQ